jgi:hypothetical protein
VVDSHETANVTSAPPASHANAALGDGVEGAVTVAASLINGVLDV